VALIVVPRVDDPAALTESAWPPALDSSRLDEIREQLARRASPAARLTVSSPVYALYRVALQAEVAAGRDPEAVAAQLNRELRALLSPWIFSAAGADRTAALAAPDETALLARLRAHPLLGRLGSFSLTRSGPDPAAQPWVVPVTAWQHQLTLSLAAPGVR
jgi:hypothetical protein